MADSPRIEELKRRVQMDPASIAFAALAEEYRRAGRFEDAIATCATGLRRHPAYLSARVTLGRAFAAVGRPGDARAEFEHVIELAPENLAAIRGLGEIYSDPDHAHDRNVACAPSPATAGESTAATASARVSRSSFTESPLVLAAPIPQHTVCLAPALDGTLGGLEEFLGAIARARTGRVLGR